MIFMAEYVQGEVRLTCTGCGETCQRPNKGLGRADIAAWKTRHQHPSPDPREGNRA